MPDTISGTALERPEFPLHIPSSARAGSVNILTLVLFRYKCVIILCDSQWCDPDLDSSNGIQMGLRDMLRIDSMLMMVQLNIRVLLEVCIPPYNRALQSAQLCTFEQSC